jgi:hypothetical protein
MAAFLEFFRCPFCCLHHDYCDADNHDFSPAAVYTFICPETGEDVKLRAVDAPSTPVAECPAHAVIVRRTVAPL